MSEAVRVLTIAIDGPAGSGKSTVSRRLARRLGLSLVDTGAIYRAVALAARRRGVPWEDGPAVAALAGDLRISFRWDGETNRVFLDGEDVSEAIRTQEIGRGASTVAAHPEVRAALLDLQRELARRPPGAVLEGRDIGTVVLPDATFKFFLTATPEERARRRTAELLARGEPVSQAEVLAEILDRDRADESRECAPLQRAPDAIPIDTSRMEVDRVVETLVAIIEGKAKG